MITVVEYDERWPAQFAAAEKSLLEALTGSGVRVSTIEHIGSTAVPGLAARPLIDCDIVVNEDDITRAAKALEGLGFTALGEMGIPQRLAFESPPSWAHLTIYVVAKDSLCLRDHIAVRDTLRASAGLRQGYAAVKREVASRTSDIFDYAYGKDAMVKEILAQSGLSEDERAVIGTHRVLRPGEGSP
jgi:GrpB-like predicted nucleotidyltransferase (UPF0157 family)